MKTKHLFTLLIFVAFFFSNNGTLNAQATWLQMDNMPVKRTQTMAFSIGTKGYLFGGFDENIDGTSTLWEWDQATDTWTQKSDIPSGERVSGIAFSIGNKGYVTIGYHMGMYNDLWEWDQATDTWTKKANLPAEPRGQSSCFVIGTKAYLAGGFDSDYSRLNDFWEWDQATDTWTQKTDLPESLSASAAFSIGTKGYLASGNSQIGQSNKLWEWDQTMDTWTQKSDIPNTRAGAIGFSYGKKGYALLGQDQNYLNDLWQWNQSTDTWTQLTDLPSFGRARGAGYIIDNKAYILGGATGPFGILNEFWELSLNLINNTDDLENQQSIEVYPNPAQDICYIQFSEAFSQAQLSITDLLGKQIPFNIRIDINANHLGILNTTNLPSGIYLITIQNNNQVYSEKLIIKH